MRILVTGADGFIGSHLTESLARCGQECTLLDIKFGRNSERIGCMKIHGDITDERTFDLIKSPPDIIIHAAAVSRVAEAEADPRKCFEVNVIGSINVIRWAISLEKIPHMIFLSSREVYGPLKSTPISESQPKNPVSVYGISKLTTEKFIKYYSRISKIKYTIVRFSNVYGSTRDLPQRVIPTFVANATRREPLTVYGREHILDFVFIDDVVDGLITTVKHIEMEDSNVVDTDFLFCGGVGHSLIEVAFLAKRLTNSDSTINLQPERDYDMDKFVGDFSKAKRVLEFVPKVSLENGMTKYINSLIYQRSTNAEN